jgi:hypothetical protein
MMPDHGPTAWGSRDLSAQVAKLECVLHYWEQVVRRPPEGNITYQLRVRGIRAGILNWLRFTYTFLRAGIRNDVTEQVRAAGARHRHSVADGRRADTAREGAVREQDRGGGARAAAD